MNFEKLLAENKFAVERYVHFKISCFEDAEDIISETYLTAFKKFETLADEIKFKPWIITIAKNKCNDYYKKATHNIEFSECDFNQIASEQNQYGRTELSDVTEILLNLKDSYRRILYLYYFCDMSQDKISEILNIPIGTVKSRLYYAKQDFKKRYPAKSDLSKGDKNMSKLPLILSDYKIKQTDVPVFDVEWQELMGWLIIPKVGEKLTWAMYDFPERKQTQFVETEVIGEAEVHGIRGVEITAKEHNPIESEKIDNELLSERRFVAQLTDTHCRFLAESHRINGINKYYTFLDGEDFIKNWGFGKDNCGKETHISQKNIISRNKNTIITKTDEECMDIVGRYIVTIGNKEFDTVCVMDICSYDSGVATEQYIDRNGKTVLWRRFNADDWKFEKYNQKWSEKLPSNERIIINGKVFVHWYDCISDYIL